MKKKFLFTLPIALSLLFSGCAVGQQGPQGEQGISGEAGQKGEAGLDGTSILTGNGEPSIDLGKNGDSYIDLITWNYYVKEQSGWVLKGNIKGAQGETGPEGPSGHDGQNGSSAFVGEGAPNEELGKVGDSYLDTQTFNFFVCEESGWVLKGNIKGANGVDGKSIVSIVIKESNDEQTTYTIYFSDQSTFDFVVKNGRDGADGSAILSDEETPDAELGKNGDYYIDLLTFDLYIKEDGTWTYLNSFKGERGQDGHSPYIQDGYWYVNNVNTGVKASANSIVSVTLLSSVLNIDTYRIAFSDGTYFNYQVVNGKSAYQIYVEMHPEYTGTEEQWIDDLANGRLKEKVARTITFVYGDGRENLIVTGYDLEPIAMPETPTREHYDFEGWYTPDGARWNFYGNVVTQNMVLTAKWTPHTFNVHYVLNGGINSPLNKDKVSMDDLPFTLSDATKTNYVLEGWYKDSGLTQKVSQLTEFGEITLYAKWAKAYEESIGLSYSLSGDETYYIVNGIGTFSGVDLVIPSEYNGKPVKEIAQYAFQDNTTLESITLPETITKINGMAFSGTTNVNEVFYNCIDAEAPTSSPFDTSYETNPEMTVYIGENVEQIPAYLFYSCDRLTYLRFSENSHLTTINKQAFRNTNVVSAEFPASLTTVCEQAFYQCSKMTQAVFTEGVEVIEKQAFSNCTQLQRLVLANSITTIDVEAFYKTNIQRFVWPNNLTSAGAKMIGQTAPEVIFDEPVTTIIPAGSFQEYKGTGFDIPDTITAVGSGAFTGATNLASFDFTHIINIYDSAFKNTGLTQLDFLDTAVAYIGAEAFDGCKLTSIKTHFVGRSETETDNQYKILGHWFSSTSYTEGYVPSGVKGVHQYTYTSFSSNNTVYYYNIPTTLTYVELRPTMQNETIIGFTNMTLNTLIIGEGVSTINGSSMKVTNLYLPASLTTISNYAFSGGVTYAYFTVTTGWKTGSNQSVTLTEAQMSDPTVAARLISKNQYSSGYCEYTFVRS